MRILFYNTGHHERSYLEIANNGMHDIVFTPERLVLGTEHLAKNFDAVSVFTSDEVNAETIAALAGIGVKHIAVRATGYDNIDLAAAGKTGITVANVPGYSPESIAEHAVTLMLALSRKLICADKQVHDYNFSIEGLLGFTLKGKTVGIIGTGMIGKAAAKILHGFGCRLLAYDVVEDASLSRQYQLEYVSLDELCSRSDIITLHVPLNGSTRHMVDAALISSMKKGVMLINTARGALVNTDDVIEYLGNGHIGYLGLDVYEKEKGIFFFDHSHQPPDDPALRKLLTFPNVIITPHQAFATAEALQTIAEVTIGSFTMWDKTGKAIYQLN